MRRRRHAPARSSSRSSPTSDSTASRRRSTPRSAARSPTCSRRARFAASPTRSRRCVHAKDQPYQARLRCRPRRPREVRALRSWRATPAPRCAISASATSQTIAFALPRASARPRSAAASFVAEGAIAGDARHDDLSHRARQAGRDRRGRDRLAAGLDRAALERGVERGTILGEAVNFARRMALTPANDMTPTHLADEAEEARRSRPGSRSTSSTRSATRKEGMGSLLVASRGQRATGEVHRDALQRRPVEQRAARARRQGHHVRLRRHLDQAGRAHARDEVRHVAAAPA